MNKTLERIIEEGLKKLEKELAEHQRWLKTDKESIGTYQLRANETKEKLEESREAIKNLKDYRDKITKSKT